MDRFHVIDEACVILRSKGLYRQAKVYRRGDAVYAGLGGGYVRLVGHGGTTRPDVGWDDIEAEGVTLTPTSKHPKWGGA